jgi:methanogenic corrinoid protein MtbC1
LERDSTLKSWSTLIMTDAGSPLYHPVSLDPEYLAGKMLERYAEVHTRTWGMTSAERKERIRGEFMATIGSLQESLATGSPAFLIDHTSRDRARFMSRPFPGGFVLSYLEVLGEVAARELPPDYREKAGRYIREALLALKKTSAHAGPRAADKSLLSPLARSFLDAILVADRRRGDAIIDEALAAGTPLRDIYLRVFQPVLVETGILWQENKATIAQEHYITGVIRQVMERVRSRVIPPVRRGRSVVTACVGEELHDTGILMVADFFGIDGWDVYSIGANTPARCILEAVKEQKADAVALSVTMPSRLPALQYLIRSLRADASTSQVKIIVGGYPFGILPDLWKQVGADACAATADDAVAAANRLVDGKQ